MRLVDGRLERKVCILCCTEIRVHLYPIKGFWWLGEQFVGHCHSIMHEYETIEISSFLGGGFQGPRPLYEALLTSLSW